jgi:hypothetical protein
MKQMMSPLETRSQLSTRSPDVSLSHFNRRSLKRAGHSLGVVIERILWQGSQNFVGDLRESSFLVDLWKGVKSSLHNAGYPMREREN